MAWGETLSVEREGVAFNTALPIGVEVAGRSFRTKSGTASKAGPGGITAEARLKATKAATSHVRPV
jgi:hypothetical protein